MKRILVTGAAGQIGSELVPALRQKFGKDNVVAAGHIERLPDEFLDGPNTLIDVTKYEDIENAIKEFRIDTVYHLASVLSALAETRRKLAYEVNFTGVNNVLEASLANGLEMVVIPSSIAAFGLDTPGENTPNDTLQKPNTVYWNVYIIGNQETFL